MSGKCLQFKMSNTLILFREIV